MKDIKSFITEMEQDGLSNTQIIFALKTYFGKHNIRFTYERVELDDDMTVYFVAWVFPNGYPETAIIFDNEPAVDWWGEEIQ